MYHIIKDVDDLLFPIEECPVYAEQITHHGTRRINVRNKRALVNANTSSVLGVVSHNYQLVTNREALAMAYDCCNSLFPETSDSEWNVTSIQAPTTMSFCHIDLTHITTSLDFPLKLGHRMIDSYGPFIRMTNSYNTARALTFQIGFHRKICSNGLIMPDSIITFRFSHLRNALRTNPSFIFEPERLAKMRASLVQNINILEGYSIPRNRFQELIQIIIGIRRPKNAQKDQCVANDWSQLVKHIDIVAQRYIDELGENAYAALNTATDLASHPPENRCIFRTRHSLQQQAGLWMGNFSKACRNPEFTLDEYIRENQESLKAKTTRPRS